MIFVIYILTISWLDAVINFSKFCVPTWTISVIWEDYMISFGRSISFFVSRLYSKIEIINESTLIDFATKNLQIENWGYQSFWVQVECVLESGTESSCLFSYPISIDDFVFQKIVKSLIGPLKVATFLNRGLWQLWKCFQKHSTQINFSNIKYY